MRMSWSRLPRPWPILAAAAVALSPEAAVAQGPAAAPRPAASVTRNAAVAPNATPTRLLVRAVAHDAKVIGSGVGGARITVRDAATGEVLAQGVQEGSTGDTRSIVSTPRARGATVFDTPGTAHFVATLDLSAPTVVEVEAEGPLGNVRATQRASATLLMVPGVDVVGEGLVLDLHGFSVEILSAEADPDGTLDVRARVTMLCGCPIEPGGLWDADRLSVTARLLDEGRTLAGEARLGFAGETSIFAGALEGAGAGRYELQVLVTDPARANTGMTSRTVVVSR